MLSGALHAVLNLILKDLVRPQLGASSEILFLLVTWINIYRTVITIMNFQSIMYSTLTQRAMVIAEIRDVGRHKLWVKLKIRVSQILSWLSNSRLVKLGYKYCVPQSSVDIKERKLQQFLYVKETQNINFTRFGDFKTFLSLEIYVCFL